eukprot:13406593-Heterocapsa_arctica.AAC.1
MAWFTGWAATQKRSACDLWQRVAESLLTGLMEPCDVLGGTLGVGPMLARSEGGCPLGPRDPGGALCSTDVNNPWIVKLDGPTAHLGTPA